MHFLHKSQRMGGMGGMGRNRKGSHKTFGQKLLRRDTKELLPSSQCNNHFEGHTLSLKILVHRRGQRKKSRSDLLFYDQRM